jgi:elongation factor P
VIERTFRTGETIEAADVEEMFMQYLYADEENYFFMNTQTYEQVGIPGESIKYESQFLTENLDVTVLFYKGKAVSINLPYFIKAEITYCEPGLRGNTATGATKPAKISTGATIQVPLFVEQGEFIQVDTRTCEYIGRVKDE